jgi:hypothetical protein
MFEAEVNPSGINKAEEAIEEDCTVFEMTKPYLVKRWLGKTSYQ